MTMDAAWIGVIGALGGVLITGIIQIVLDHIRASRENSQRWLDDKRNAYASFSLNLDQQFRSYLSVRWQKENHIAEHEIKETMGKMGQHSEKLNDVQAMVNILGPKELSEKANEIREWTSNVMLKIESKKLTDKNMDKLLKEHKAKIEDFLKLAKKDLN